MTNRSCRVGPTWGDEREIMKKILAALAAFAFLVLGVSLSATETASAASDGPYPNRKAANFAERLYPAQQATETAVRKHLSKVVFVGTVYAGPGKPHYNCWAAEGPTTFIVCQDGYRTTS